MVIRADLGNYQLLYLYYIGGIIYLENVNLAHNSDRLCCMTSIVA